MMLVPGPIVDDPAKDGTWKISDMGTLTYTFGDMGFLFFLRSIPFSPYSWSRFALFRSFVTETE